jgi:hypothetical protein
LKALSSTMLSALPDSFEAREIDHGEDRRGLDVQRTFFAESFDHAARKIWICEELICGATGKLPRARIPDGPNLVVSRWISPRAPYPRTASSRIDLKGGVVGGKQPKDPWRRACFLHERGWT